MTKTTPMPQSGGSYRLEKGHLTQTASTKTAPPKGEKTTATPAAAPSKKEA